MTRLFKDRSDAGKRLADRLHRYRNDPDTIVLGLPRGGVPVAYEVAERLDAPLDVFVVRKLGTPGQKELAMGAIASGGVTVLDNTLIGHLHLHSEDIRRVIEHEQTELTRRERAYRDDRPPVDVRGKTVILVDDGLATGSTMRAAVRALRKSDPERIVVAVPTAAISTCEALREEVEDVVCATTPYPFQSVGQWYEDFSQTTDDEVRELLQRAERRHTTQLGTF